LTQLSYLIGPTPSSAVPIEQSHDQILKVSGKGSEFIPQPRALSNTAPLTFLDNPDRDGIFSITTGDSIIQNISFNYSREESKLVYMDLDNIKNGTKQTSIPSLVETMENEDRVTELWKWFVIFALIFFGIETLIQKFFK